MRPRRLPNEGELIPFTPGFPPGRRWLVLAPHPDDELFGLGATLAQALRRGVEATLVVVTDGAAQGDATIREREARAAAAALGLPEPEFWGHADRSLAAGDVRLRRAIAGALATATPDVVFVTSPVELHPDHRALALALQRVLRRWLVAGLRRRPPAWVVAYEVGTPLLPNLLVAADESWETKLQAGQCYASQLSFRPYQQVADALAVFRSLTLSGVRRAEAMHLLPASRVAHVSAHRWASLLGSPRGVMPSLARE